MPIKKSKVTDRTSAVTFDLVLRNDETGEVETEKVCAKVRSLSYERWQKLFNPDSNAGVEAKEVLAAQLSEIVADLDIVDDNGNPFAPTVENLRTIDMPILTQYSEAILSFFVPQKEEGKRSAASTPGS